MFDAQLQEDFLVSLRTHPEETLDVTLARSRVTKSLLDSWRKSDPAFLVPYNEIARDRGRPVRLRAPRVASRACVVRVLTALAEAPALGITIFCQTAGTTRAKVEATIAAHQDLQDLYDLAVDSMVVDVEQRHLSSMEQPAQHVPRGKFLRQHGGAIWAAPSDETKRLTGAPVHVSIAILQEAPKARLTEDGRYAPLDIPVSRLVAADQLPGSTEAS